jgi:hypothetical protein
MPVGQSDDPGLDQFQALQPGLDLVAASDVGSCGGVAVVGLRIDGALAADVSSLGYDRWRLRGLTRRVR